jgi:hypothetical protein
MDPVRKLKSIRPNPSLLLWLTGCGSEQLTSGEDPPSQFLPAKGLVAGFSADDMVISMYE